MADIENRELRDFLKGAGNGSKSVRSTGKSSVIKNIRTRQSDKGPVKIPVHQTVGASQPQVEPILEGGLIVGIQFTCSCHRMTEIRFEYDDPGLSRPRTQ